MAIRYSLHRLPVFTLTATAQITSSFPNGATRMVFDADETSAHIAGSIDTYRYPGMLRFTDDATPDISRNPANVLLDGTTTLTDFDNGAEGQSFLALINGTQTIDFTGTNLRGNGGSDLSAAADDSMWCVVRGGQIYCFVNDV